MTEAELLAEIAGLRARLAELSGARLEIARLAALNAVLRSRLFAANKRAWDYREGYLRLKRKYEGVTYGRAQKPPSA